MAESPTHGFFVEEIVNWLMQGNDAGREYVVMNDVAGQGPNRRPPIIDGFIPDVYAVAHQDRRIIIGEAKTIMDIESTHSRMQYAAYLRHCKAYPSAALLLAVPWTMVNCTKGLLKAIKRQTDTQLVEVILLKDLPEQAASRWSLR